MKIKALNQERRQINIKEWNDEVPVYIRPLNGFEQLVFNDYFLTFYSKERDYNERLEAGFNAAKMALIIEDGAPFLNDEDIEAIRNASVVPLYRLFNEVLAETRGEELDTAKKN